jgi:hypothetical protein
VICARTIASSRAASREREPASARCVALVSNGKRAHRGRDALTGRTIMFLI